MNILEQANQIVNKRSEEKERMYGPFSEGMERAAMIMKGMTGKEITGEDMYAALVALKLSRESYNKKYDNLLDAIAYLGAMYNHSKDEYDATK
jgi:DNA-binding protein H-NS